MRDIKQLPMSEDLWGYRKRLEFVVSSIDTAFGKPDKEEVSILDVGCGSATQLGLPLARWGYSITGIDLHEPSIRVATEKAAGLGNASFICGNVEDISGQFNVVILSEVLEHVAEPGELLSNSLKRLQEGGLMIVTVPNGYGEFEWDSWIFRGLGLERLVEAYIERKMRNSDADHPVSSTENHESRHVQFFTLSRLQTIFDSAGLEIVRKQGSTFMSGPFAGHLLGRSETLINWNARVADTLPMSMSSGWFFALRRSGEGT